MHKILTSTLIITILASGCGSDCGKEGERIRAADMPETCCSGLESLEGGNLDKKGECRKIPPPGGVSICSNCGDGICNKDTLEDKCNCPKDCKSNSDNFNPFL